MVDNSGHHDPGYDKNARTLTPWDYVIGCGIGFISGGISETCVFPLDKLKTRMVLQGESASKDLAPEKGNALKTLWSMGNREGIKSLWFGLSASWYRQFLYAGFGTQIYQFIRIKWGRDPDGTFPLWKACSSASIAGATGELMASPFVKVRIQLQMEGLKKLKGHPPRVTGVWQGIFASYRKGGLKSLWRGAVPNCQRSAIVTFAGLGFYDSSKHALINQYGWEGKYWVIWTAGFISGFWASLLACPLESIQTRIINQPLDERGRGLYYNGTWDCFKKTVGNEGFVVLYRPFQAIWLRSGSFALIFWTSMETLRDWFGLPEF